MKKHLPLLLFILLSFFVAQQAYAASITISGGPTNIGVNDEYNASVHVSINADDGKVYYLRGAFHRQNSSGYCGITWNGSDWYSNPIGTGTNFLPITITNNAWDGVIKAKIDSSDNSCNTSGTYYFKVYRYTGSSSSGNDDTVEEQEVTITIPTPTPTPTDVPTPTVTPKPPTFTPTPKIPTTTPTPKIPTATPTIKVTSKISTPTLDPSDREGGNDQAILADAIAPTDAPTISPSPTTAVLEATTGPNFKAIIFYSLGGILFVICGILLYRQFRLSQFNESASDNN